MSATSTVGASAVSTASGGGVVYSGFGGSAATSTAASGGSSLGATIVLPKLGQAYGLEVVVAGIIAGFSLL